MLEWLTECLREAGKIVFEAKNIADATHAKHGAGNFVTDYDTKVQAFLYDELQKISPATRMIGEEDVVHNSCALRGDCFIIDPIDGTANFIRGYRHSGISVAFLQDGVAEAGAVYNPYLDEMFYAQRRHGAFCNGKKLQVSSRGINESIALFGASCYQRELMQKTLDVLNVLFKNIEDVRSSGSAALDLCYVAAGRCDIFFEMQLSPWDYAAGGLILEEAGGCISDIAGRSLSYISGGSVLGAGKKLHGECVKLIETVT